jgi:hypothetical protein
MLIGLQEAGHRHHWIHFLWLYKLPTEDWLTSSSTALEKPSRAIIITNSRSNKKNIMGEQIIVHHHQVPSSGLGFFRGP